MRSLNLCILALLAVNSLAAIIPRDPASHLLKGRSTGQGWSLQASTCPASSTSCGGGACCPSSLYCVTAATDEVAACCTSSSACRGSIEGNPVCADTSWSLWKGFQGNGFCCAVGMVGVYYSTAIVAGTCASSAPAGATSAVLMSKGSGSPTTTTTTTSKPTSSTTTTSKVSSTTTTSSSGTGSTGKPVFFHYLIGTITDAHCATDILNAQALGADGFALNINTVTASWATTTVASLFKWANTYNFKLFFSFDMTGFSNPSQFTSFLESYVTNAAHYKYDGLPFVSTFNGGASQYTFGQDSVNDGWKIEFQQVMANAGYPVYFVPAFQDVAASSSFFTTFPTLNGAMNWNSWPFSNDPDQGKIIVPTTDDQTYLTAAHAAGKVFMMGLSPLQFKHIDSGDNWYRRGEENLEYRFGQVLSLQPDLLEMQTWNDGGESHYMGNSWPEPIEGTAIVAYTEAYDHTGYWQVLAAFIKAWKAGATSTATMYPTNGAAAQGVFWHHTLLTTSDCSSDPLGKPSGSDDIEDKVTVVVLVAAGQTSLEVVITLSGTTLGSQTLVPGYNQFSVSNLAAGTVAVKVVNTASSNSVVVSGTGPIAVTTSASLCNYNFQVVGLS